MIFIIPVLYIAVPTYLLMALIGLVVAIIFIYRRKEKTKINLNDIVWFLIGSIILGFVGARILFVISRIPTMEQITINELFHQLLNGGIVFYGGLFGVIVGIRVVAKYRRLNARNMLNVLAPAFPLFHAFARFGCLLAGCCYGIECSWGVVLAGEPDVIRFPVQFFECIFNLLIFKGIVTWERKNGTSKYNLTIYLCSYAICRFVLEFFRGDAIRGMWLFGLSTAQYISIFILMYYIIYSLWSLIRKKQLNEESLHLV